MEALKDAHKYKLWKQNLINHKLDIQEIQEVHSRRYPNGEILFSLVLLDAQTPEGNKIPPLCLIKGEVVMVLVCLIDKETNEKYLLLVKQRRIADGNLQYEHPAGMVDRTSKPSEIAVLEVKEETGLSISVDQLKPILNYQKLYPSTGTSDECMYFFYTELILSKSEIDKLDHTTKGLSTEDEYITTHVFPFEEAHKKLQNTNCILLSIAYLMDVKDYQLLEMLKV